MSSVVISGDTSGAITLAAPTVAGANTITLPAVTGTAVVQGQNSAITASTAQASTSGTSIDFTSIPSWVKRITVMFSGVSTSGTSIVQVQLGAGSVTTTGYLGTYGAWVQATLPSATLLSTGFGIYTDAATNVRHGSLVLNNLSSNTWTCSGVLAFSDKALQITTAGSIALGGTLDRIRITTVNGTDTFDAGSINILYE